MILDGWLILLIIGIILAILGYAFKSRQNSDLGFALLLIGIILVIIALVLLLVSYV
jgi:hypothetical protein